MPTNVAQHRAFILHRFQFILNHTINVERPLQMANACFQSHNAPGNNCKDPTRGSFQIPTGATFEDIGPNVQNFKVTYFKFAARQAYDVHYELVDGPIWNCTCPDFEFNDRLEQKTACKHIQACVDKINGTTRTGGNYEKFLVEHIH